MPPASSSATGRSHELVPLYRDPQSDMPVTQFNMKWVEQAGLVKFDFLGLKTLTVLDTARQARQPARHRARPLAHPARRCQELSRCWRAARRSACSRWKGGHAARAGRHAAGPLRGHHRAGRALPAGPDGEHPDLLRAQARPRAGRLHASEAEPILEATYGVITYQEQVQQIAKDLAGYTLGEADLLRRAMGKKIKKRDGRAARRLPRRRRRARHRARRTPKRSSTPARNSPNTASTSRTRRPMRCSPTRPPT